MLRQYKHPNNINWNTPNKINWDTAYLSYSTLGRISILQFWWVYLKLQYSHYLVRVSVRVSGCSHTVRVTIPRYSRRPPSRPVPGGSSAAPPPGPGPRSHAGWSTWEWSKPRALLATWEYSPWGTAFKSGWVSYCTLCSQVRHVCMHVYLYVYKYSIKTCWGMVSLNIMFL